LLTHNYTTATKQTHRYSLKCVLQAPSRGVYVGEKPRTFNLGPSRFNGLRHILSEPLGSKGAFTTIQFKKRRTSYTVGGQSQLSGAPRRPDWKYA